MDGLGYSDTELLTIPNVKSANAFLLNLINPLEKVKYREGDRLVAKIKTGRALNYLVLCNSKHVIATGVVRDDGLVAFDITSRMEGFCVLVVYGITNTWFSRTKSDFWLFFVEKQNCQPPV